MENPKKLRLARALILFENIAIVSAVLGRLLMWQMPYRFSPTTHRIMTFIMVLNSWVIIAAILFGIVAVMVTSRGFAQKTIADKRIFLWAVISLLVTVLWTVAWSLSVSVHSVSVQGSEL